MPRKSSNPIRGVIILVAALTLGAGTTAWAVNSPTSAHKKSDTAIPRHKQLVLDANVNNPAQQAPGSSLEGIGVFFDKVATYVGAVQAHQLAVTNAEIATKQAQEAELERQGAELQQASSTIQSRSDGLTAAQNGCAIPAYICSRESNNTLNAMNSSGAAGKYQFMPGTWNGYGGYASAADAPEAVQDAKAAEVWAGGAGCGNWSAC